MSTSLNTRWQAWLATRAPRERLVLQAAAWLLLAALIWSLAIAPAWRVLQAAPARQAALLPQLHRIAKRVIWLGPGDVGLAPLFRPPFSWWISRRSRQVENW